MVRGGRSLAVLSRLVLAAVLGAVAIVAAPVPRAAADTLEVTNTNYDGPGSLRQAIIAAQPGDTITFHPSTFGGTIALADDQGYSSHALFITKAITIRGPGANLLTISGSDAQQIFNVSVGDQDQVVISGLTLTRGYAKACISYCEISGGAIAISSGKLTLSHIVVSGNRAQGGGGGLHISPNVYGDPPTLQERNVEVTLTDSVISNNVTEGVGNGSGGGITMHGGNLIIERTTISGNVAALSAGGLYISRAYGPVSATIRNSTISGNRANSGGGGIGISDAGAGINVVSSTIFDNWADADNNNSGYGGGIAIFSYSVETQIYVRNSLIIGNHAPSDKGPDCSGPSIGTHGHNIWGVMFDCPTNGPGDLTLAGLGVGAGAVLDPALALNAPGTTLTHALVPGSPAIGAAEGGANCPVSDQRGVARPQGTGCDIGAFEFDRLYSVALMTEGPGLASPSSAGPYGATQQVTLTATWDDATARFAGWRLDGVLAGWANPLVLPIGGVNHAVAATFVPRKTFGDVTGDRPDYLAITELASRGTILGYGNGRYGPDDGVQRAQMAALIARATPNGPGTPPITLAPPVCLVGGTWDCEEWGSDFTDQNGLDPNLWRNVGTLQHYAVAFGYDGAGCAARNVPSPCFAPTEAVSYAQTISFITRAMKAKGFWDDQPGQAIPYSGVPPAHLGDFRTFYAYTQGDGGIPMPPADWNAGARRGWFAMALWAALDSYYSENHLP